MKYPNVDGLIYCKTWALYPNLTTPNWSKIEHLRLPQRNALNAGRRDEEGGRQEDARKDQGPLEQ